MLRNRARAASAPDGADRLEQLVRRLLDLLGRITGLESTYLTFIDRSAGVQEILYARNTGDLEMPEGLEVDWTDTLCRRALDGGPRSTSDVPAAYPDSAAAAELGITSYVTVPVRNAAGDVFGTVCGADTRSVEVAGDALAVMETVAEMIALQLENDAVRRELTEANEALAELAFVDGLTGLGNRRALDRARDHLTVDHAVASVIVVDVDWFKAINDAHGHAIGDAVLRTISERLRAESRTADVVVRSGGDEFVVILHGTGPVRAREVAERFRHRVADDPVVVDGHRVAVTVSVGVASGVGGVDQLMQRADHALYDAKRLGRDAVAAAG